MIDRAEQAAAILHGVGFSLINIEFRAALSAVIDLAGEAFDDDGMERPGNLKAVERINPTLWPFIKGELECSLAAQELPTAARREWETAFAAVYSMAGVSDVQPRDGL